MPKVSQLKTMQETIRKHIVQAPTLPENAQRCLYPNLEEIAQMGKEHHIDFLIQPSEDSFEKFVVKVSERGREERPGKDKRGIPHPLTVTKTDRGSVVFDADSNPETFMDVFRERVGSLLDENIRGKKTFMKDYSVAGARIDKKTARIIKDRISISQDLPKEQAEQLQDKLPLVAKFANFRKHNIYIDFVPGKGEHAGKVQMNVFRKEISESNFLDCTTTSYNPMDSHNPFGSMLEPLKSEYKSIGSVTVDPSAPVGVFMKDFRGKADEIIENAPPLKAPEVGELPFAGLFKKVGAFFKSFKNARYMSLSDELSKEQLAKLEPHQDFLAKVGKENGCRIEIAPGEGEFEGKTVLKVFNEKYGYDPNRVYINTVPEQPFGQNSAQELANPFVLRNKLSGQRVINLDAEPKAFEEQISEDVKAIIEADKDWNNKIEIIE